MKLIQLRNADLTEFTFNENASHAGSSQTLEDPAHPALITLNISKITSEMNYKTYLNLLKAEEVEFSIDQTVNFTTRNGRDCEHYVNGLGHGDISDMCREYTKEDFNPLCEVEIDVYGIAEEL
jgi:hypothetical protein